jgi:DDE superfamily endonuclease
MAPSKGFVDQGNNKIYSGYKKQHGYKYQAVVCPDGLVAALSGPYEGRANDFYMVKDSKLGRRL